MHKSEKKLAEILNQMATVVYDSVQYQTLNAEFEKTQKNLESSKQEISRYSSSNIKLVFYKKFRLWVPLFVKTLVEK